MQSTMEITIPEERAKVINKDVVESLKNRDIHIKKDNNHIFISAEALDILIGKNIINAIGRGFAPEKALLLGNAEYMFEVIDIGNFSESRQRQIKARIIGMGGKIRGLIEKSTGCFVSVYGKTVSIIGKWADLQNARQAISMLIEGSKISNVQRFLLAVRKERL